MTPPFTMSVYGTELDLYKAKAMFFEELCKYITNSAFNAHVDDLTFREMVKHATFDYWESLGD